ncbi:hypothetical protein [Massilia antarctica]|uniref:hypothetical protein n=1 Tax=Massilia antarctica TaxID=2765360 RepID=UPI002271910E|nr:hypothetical protein [Massilia sp. H27-R4]MCY0910854.1 hypothetical protein [Massilia sp. H27-R4]
MNGTTNPDALPWVDMAYAASGTGVAVSETRRAVSDIAKMRRDLERRLQTLINAELGTFIDATGMVVDALTVNILRPGSIDATRQIGRIQSVVLDISVRR